MEKYDVVIIGAGPAGLKAAEVLARGGKKAIVFEKGKVIGDKVCAGGITNKDLKYNIPTNLISRSFNRLCVSTQRQRIFIEEKEPFLYTIDRRVLGKWQAECAKKAGVIVKVNTRVNHIKESSVITTAGEFSYNYLIGADGASSIVRKYLGIKTDELVLAFHYIVPRKFDYVGMHLDPTRFGYTYIWIYPHKDFTSIGTGIDIGFSIPLEKLKEEFNIWLKENDIDVRNLKFEAAPISYDYEGHEFDNIFLVGDAGGFTSGITGEGIYSALLSGEEVAKKIINKDYETPDLKKWLACKRIHDKLLKTIEINKIASEFLFEFGLILVRSEIFEDEFMKLAYKYKIV
jgi:geranylgeranyl reductase family protein